MQRKTDTGGASRRKNDTGGASDRKKHRHKVRSIQVIELSPGEQILVVSRPRRRRRNNNS